MAFMAITVFVNPDWVGWTRPARTSVFWVLLAAIVMTQSRQAIIGLVVAIIFVVLRRGVHGRSRFALLLLIPAVWLIATTVIDQVESQNKFNSLYQRIDWVREVYALLEAISDLRARASLLVHGGCSPLPASAGRTGGGCLRRRRGCDRLRGDVDRVLRRPVAHRSPVRDAGDCSDRQSDRARAVRPVLGRWAGLDSVRDRRHLSGCSGTGCSETAEVRMSRPSSLHP